ncbi:MAG TPA: hypothetical protein VM121_02825, partial [Acidimicrobiales bacterium]|nr:hypothetical protein [Acidimicrobiales bacterium]
IHGYIVELGTDGRLIRLQLEELLGGVEDDRRLVIKDYYQTDKDWRLPEAMTALADITTEDLLDLKSVIEVLHLSSGASELDAGLQPRGYRLLARVPRLPDAVVDRIVERFESLHKILRASVADLDEVEGVGEARARAIEESLRRLAETSILDRYG